MLAHGIAEDQPFVDGNKRTAMIALLTFVELNGKKVATTEGRLAFQIHRVSEGLSAEALAERIRSAMAGAEE